MNPATESVRLVGDYALIGAELIAGGAIDIAADGTIAAAGIETSLGATTAPVRRVGGLLMPGLVNSHAHTPMTLMRSAGDGMPLQQWLTDSVWPREMQMTPDDARWAMLLGSAEMLLAGVTTSCEMYLHEESVVDAVRDSGARLVVTPGILPALEGDGAISDRIEEIARFHQTHHDRSTRVTVGFGPHALYTLSPENLKEIAERARAVDALVHIHLEETQHERDQVIDMWTGHSATELLAEAGVLDGRVLAAHGVWLSESDRGLLGDAGAAVAHCPVSNLKLGSGIAPVTAMRDSGITVGLGTDGVASNDNLDLWQELRLAPLLARGTGFDAEALSATTALEMATVDGARAIGLDDVGVLQAGYQADVLRVDLDQPAFTPGIESELIANLVFASSSCLVTDVWVGGARVVADNQCVTVDVAQAMSEVRARGRRLLGSA